jgi:hypothetical protein
MINSSLIIPTETPITIDDVKRALITFDKVYLPSPDDREFIPPNIYENVQIQSLGFDFPMLFGGSRGPVRPLGKTEGYDDSFQKMFESCKSIVNQNKLEILGAPKYVEEFTIGAIPIPDDTPNPLFTYVNYRRLAESQEFVDAVGLGLEKIDIKKIKDPTLLAPSGLEDIEQTINNISQNPKAKIIRPGLDDSENKILTNIAHARIGSLVKYIGYCQNKQISPFTTDKGMASVLSRLEYQFIGNIESIDKELDFIKRQKRINALQNLVFREYIDPTKLKKLSVEDILKFRTKAWGKNYEGKYRLWDTINEIAAGCETDKEFELECKKKVEEYLKVSEDYRNELDKIKLSVVIDANLFVMLGTEGFELIERILKAPSFELLLIIGGLTVKSMKDNIVGVIDLLDKARQNKMTNGYSIYNHYKYLV